MTAPHGRALFEAVVERTGLASFIGPGAVERALESVGAAPDAATVDDYRRALPQLRTRMAVYLKASELQEKLSALDALFRS
ncbi:MAG TPA: hypothetical protein VN947_06210 [Polyangia bacterium]|nr:hypothetical protein [Polyangia bacterium]